MATGGWSRPLTAPKYVDKQFADRRRHWKGNNMNEGSRILDDLGRLMNEAAGVADGVRREIETMVSAQMQRFVNEMNLVKREDYDALREMVQNQAEELAALKKEMAALKTRKKTS